MLRTLSWPRLQRFTGRPSIRRYFALQFEHPCRAHQGSIQATTIKLKYLYVITTQTRSITSSSRNVSPDAKEQLCESTLLLQEGIDIQEVPLALIRATGEERQEIPKPFAQLKAEEEAAIVEGFKRFNSPEDILSVLHTVPAQEVTPAVALSILRKLLQVENDFVLKNDGKSWVIALQCTSQDTFARWTIVSRLFDILALSGDTSHLLDALDLLRSDRKAIATNVIRLNEGDATEYLENQMRNDDEIFEFSKYRTVICEEVLVRIVKGLLSLEQACHAVCTIGKISQLFPGELDPDFVDKMWIGISERSESINEGNIAEVFRTIQYFKKGQRLVMRIAERKFLIFSWNIKIDSVAQICHHLLMEESEKGLFGQQYWGVTSSRLLASVSKIVHCNLHQLTEAQLVKITKTFFALDYYDSIFEKTLSKYVKARCLKLSNSSTLVTVMDYVRKNRIRSASILDAVAEYLVQFHGANENAAAANQCQLTATQFSSLLIPFGYLDFQPSQSIATQFWSAAEYQLAQKFSEMSPKEVIDSMLACIYLQKYPLNFVHRIFTTYFLDRLHTSETDANLLQETRNSLKILDTALLLECPTKYAGPNLPRDFTFKSLFLDGRISMMRSILQESLALLYKPNSYKIEFSLVLPNLPLHRQYIVDIMISPITSTVEFQSLEDRNLGNHFSATSSTRSSVLRSIVALRDQYKLRTPTDDQYLPLQQSSDYKAIIINVPENYASDGRTLLGSEAMRIRHLKLLGFIVSNLSFEILSSLRHTPNALLEYIKTQIKG